MDEDATVEALASIAREGPIAVRNSEAAAAAWDVHEVGGEGDAEGPPPQYESEADALAALSVPLASLLAAPGGLS